MELGGKEDMGESEGRGRQCKRTRENRDHSEQDMKYELKFEDSGELVEAEIT